MLKKIINYWETREDNNHSRREITST